MRLLQELATQVLLGTERRPPVLPPLSGAFGELIEVCARGADLAPEVRVLRAAGATAVCAAAGFVPPTGGEDLPAPCPPETLQQVADTALLSALRQILADGPDPLRHEALRLLAARASCLPAGMLPDALAMAQRTPELRPALLPVLGQRGQWLAQFNPAWSSWLVIAAEPAPDQQAHWEHGTLEQRRQWLGGLRQSDPARARSLLAEGFGALDARERASLLEQIGIGLAAADEDFLETALADRSKEVRQVAGSLLARLPGSRYGSRMAERMAACLRQERKLFRQVWLLEPPEQFGADWKADALEQSRAKSESLGERAWWLYQIARALPLAWWQAQTGMTPAEITKWAMDSDWSEALFRAWSEALMRQPDADWATAFLTHSPLIGLSAGVFDLLGCLPIAEREPHWLRMLEAGTRHIGRGDLLGHIVQSVQNTAAAGAPLSAGFVRRLLAEIRTSLPTDAAKWDYSLRKTLPEFVCLIPPECFADATQGWPLGQAATEYFDESMARVLAIVEQRKTLHRTLSERKSP